MASSNVQRTMGALRKEGAKCAVVEKWNAYAGPHGVRQDLFGIIDILVLDPELGVLGIQACAGSGYSAHYKKLTEEKAQESIDWLETQIICPFCDNHVAATRLYIYAWRKIKLKKGGKAMRWQPRIKEITLKDIGVHEVRNNATQ